MANSVLICGAGPAGMALAHLLHVDGWTVTVVERAPSVRAGGYAVDLRDHGIAVAAELGVLDDLRAHSTNMTGTTLVDADGTAIGELHAEEFAGQLEVPKPALVDTLFARTRHEVQYLFGESIAALDQHDDRVTATLDSGTRRSVDLVVGADGLWSTTRRLAITTDEHAIRHLKLSGAGFSTDNFLDLDHHGVLRTGAGTAVYAFHGGQDLSRMTVSLTFGTDSAVLDRRDRAEQESAVRAAFADEGWQVPRLLDAMTAADDFYFASACQVQLSTWHNGRVVLVGDAACCAAPTSGMGTTQAFVGAHTLARRLRDTDVTSTPDVLATLDSYERELRPFTERNQALGAEAAARFGAND